MSDQVVTVVMLAAGAGSRFVDVGHKLLAELPATSTRPAEPVIARSVAAACEAELGDVVVVTGSRNAAELGIEESPGVSVAPNLRWADGQMTSVQVGLAEARTSGATVAVIGLADQPGITASAWRNVAAAATAEQPIAVATYDGARGNPVALHRSIWHLVSRSGDVGARGLMRIRGDLVVQVTCDGQPHDIDTVEDLHRWQNN